ncbi:MAG: M18 family aminopeptidase [Eubacterium sp.]|nr:M18 family aminopeptidase [Eubacterium sp.]
MFERITEETVQFIQESPTAFHVTEGIRRRLLEAGFRELDERKRNWLLEPGGKYFVRRNGSSVISFRLPAGALEAIHLTASHSDAPGFKIKPDPEIESAGCVKLNIEPYGGMLKATWYDRPLTVAGRVLYDDGGAIRSSLIHIQKDLMIIPSLAIHMNRDANEKTAGNVQTDMLPLFAAGEKQGDFLKEAAAAAGLSADETDRILDMDLFLVNRMEPSVWGKQGAFLSGPRLDDLMCCYATFAGFTAAGSSDGILAMHCVFDNEEVGSRTKQGAESTFLPDCLTRIAEALGVSWTQMLSAAAKGLMISADNAHAVHPNHVDKADPVNRPVINGGIVLKSHAGQKYTTDAVSAAHVIRLCRAHGIKMQRFVNRSDQAGGSTLGNIANTQLSMNTADIGLAQLAMHSAYETAGTEDLKSLAEFCRYFYEEALAPVAEY